MLTFCLSIWRIHSTRASSVSGQETFLTLQILPIEASIFISVFLELSIRLIVAWVGTLSSLNVLFAHLASSIWVLLCHPHGWSAPASLGAPYVWSVSCWLSSLERFWKICLCLCLCLSPTRNGQIDINICFGSRPFGAAQICLCLTMSISHLPKILRTHGTHLVEAGLLDDDDLAILLYWTSLRGPRILHDVDPYYLHVHKSHFKTLFRFKRDWGSLSALLDVWLILIDRKAWQSDLYSLF